MKLSDLSNEEVVFIHLVMEAKLEALNEVLDKGGITFVVDSPLGKVTVFGQFSTEELADLEVSPKYELSQSIIKKLAPVYELIGESNKDIIDSVRRSLFPKSDNNEEED